LCISQYIQPDDDAPAVRRVVRAAALTYVVGPHASVLSLARWFALLRRA
jgi:Zn-dependent membrane protease YugP